MSWACAVVPQDEVEVKVGRGGRKVGLWEVGPRPQPVAWGSGVGSVCARNVGCSKLDLFQTRWGVGWWGRRRSGGPPWGKSSVWELVVLNSAAAAANARNKAFITQRKPPQ